MMLPTSPRLLDPEFQEKSLPLLHCDEGVAVSWMVICSAWDAHNTTQNAAFSQACREALDRILDNHPEPLLDRVVWVAACLGCKTAFEHVWKRAGDKESLGIVTYEACKKSLSFSHTQRSLCNTLDIARMAQKEDPVLCAMLEKTMQNQDRQNADVLPVLVEKLTATPPDGTFSLLLSGQREWDMENILIHVLKHLLKDSSNTMEHAQHKATLALWVLQEWNAVFNTIPNRSGPWMKTSQSELPKSTQTVLKLFCDVPAFEKSEEPYGRFRFAPQTAHDKIRLAKLKTMVSKRPQTALSHLIFQKHELKTVEGNALPPLIHALETWAQPTE